MSIPPWLCGLIAIPIFYLFFFTLYHVMAGVHIFIKIFFGLGSVAAIVLFLIKWTGRERSVCPINGGLNKNHDRLYERFSDEGFAVEEYKLLDCSHQGNSWP